MASEKRKLLLTTHSRTSRRALFVERKIRHIMGTDVKFFATSRTSRRALKNLQVP